MTAEDRAVAHLHALARLVVEAEQEALSALVILDNEICADPIRRPGRAALAEIADRLHAIATDTDAGASSGLVADAWEGVTARCAFQVMNDEAEAELAAREVEP